jgi:molybdate transport system ATP-binding protein
MNSGLQANLHLVRDDFRLDASFDASGGGITAIFGASGAGKSTLLRAIAGLEKSTGQLTIGNKVWQDDNVFVPTHQRAVGFVFQESDLFSHLSVRGNLEYGYKRTPANTRQIEFDQAVDLLSLDNLLDKHATQLSGGERKRVAIARALLSSPQLLLMDEPLASLDSQHRQEVMPFLEQLHNRLALPILYVSHSMDEIMRLADNLILLDRGRVTATGPINEVLTRFDLPVAHEYDAGAVLETTVTGYDPQFNLTTLDFGGGTLLVPGKLMATGSATRVRVLARDVSLTLQRQTATSILNIVPAQVTATTGDGAAGMLVRLDAAGSVLLARITRKSLAMLKLEPGKHVWAQIKTVALLGQ